VKRIEVVYDGIQYTIGNTDLADLKARILDVASGGEPFWLPVNRGEGLLQVADLLITATSQVSLIGIDAD
jgi:hypothetical protein